MSQASFHFFGDLNHFLASSRQATAFLHDFEHVASIKDMVESLGVPHPEIDLIVVNDVSVDFDYIVKDQDRICVYPFYAEVDHIEPQIRLRPAPLDVARFVLDVHLGKLASHLRMLGFDTLYRNDYEDDELAHVSSAEDRILLTRDLGVLKRGVVKHGYYVRNKKPDRQLIEILQRYALVDEIVPFRRCMNCNGHLMPVDKADLVDDLPPKIRAEYDSFHRCADCGKVYWKGSHHARMRGFIKTVLGAEIK